MEICKSEVREMANKSDYFITEIDEMLSIMLDRIVNKMKEEKDYLPSLEQLNKILCLIELKVQYAHYYR